MKTHARGRHFIISGPDYTNQHVYVAKKRVYFDFCCHTGPLVTDAHGTPLDEQPTRENDPFWPSFRRWLARHGLLTEAQEPVDDNPQ